MLEVYLRQGQDTYGLLADALALHGVSSLPPMARETEGKPYFPSRPDLCFNLSHTKGWVLCALSDRPVGVDIEVIRPRREGLFRFCLTAEEYARFGGGWTEFYRLWTLKEALCKYHGQALGDPRRWVTPPALPHRSWVTDSFTAAVCGEELPPEWILLHP